MDFEEFFERATGRAPYAFQRDYAVATPRPSLLRAPTGSGKTQAVIVAWLWQRRTGDAPRRLVYCLPMRSLVEQTAEVARELVARLGTDVPVRVLMGGTAPEGDDWRSPDQPQILVGTQDMLLSRALNRGYTESRFVWPISFGLLNSDCRWVMDEVQLMGPGRTTTAQLDGLRGQFETAAPCESVWVSATLPDDALKTVDRPSPGTALAVGEADRAGPLAARLTATKRLRRVDAAGDDRFVPAAVESLLAAHRPGRRTLVVVNTVRRARELHEALRQATAPDEAAPRLVLVHSRYRPRDRAARFDELIADPGPSGAIVVATQVVEAGVDLTSAVLATETAPWSSIVQRLGRCNRAGEEGAEGDGEAGAEFLWLDTGDPTDKTALPYTEKDLAATREALRALIGESLSPARLERVEVAEQTAVHATLRARDLLDLFDTAPDLSGRDIDVAPFVRDSAERSVDVFFRDVPAQLDPDDALQASPARDELVSVPVGDLPPARAKWRWDFADRRWQPVSRARPGLTLLLRAADGGYDPELGWDPKIKRPVPVVVAELTGPPEAFEDDDRSLDRPGWVTLTDHLGDTETAAAQFVEAVDPIGLSQADRRAAVFAAAVHDAGKAHHVFQDLLQKIATDAERAGVETDVWAKSARLGGRYERRYFRHELASALQIRARARDLDLAADEALLVAYLAAAHHGRVRLAIRPAPGEEAPRDAPSGTRFALGVWDGDTLPAIELAGGRGSLPEATVDLRCMELGGADEHGPSWTAGALDLLTRLGPFRLAYLEALVRLADWRASDAPSRTTDPTLAAHA